MKTLKIKKIALGLFVSSTLLTSCEKENSPQTWIITFHDEGLVGRDVDVKVVVSPFTNSGTFSETSDSEGLWMYDAQGQKCYRLPVGGNIVHDGAGDRWSFMGMSGSGCGMSTMAGQSSGTANGHFPDASQITNGYVNIYTSTPMGSGGGSLSWSAVKL